MYTVMEMIKPQRCWGHKLDLLRPRHVIGHVTIRLVTIGFLLSYRWSIVIMRISFTVMGI